MIITIRKTKINHIKYVLGAIMHNRETGENPVLSRSCNVESISICHWETGKAKLMRKQSQNNYLKQDCKNSAMDGMVTLYRCTLLLEAEGYFLVIKGIMALTK